MDTLVIDKTEHSRILEGQRELQSQINYLGELFKMAIADEVIQPSVLKRLETRSIKFDQGKGKKFSTLSSFKNYLAEL